MILYISGPMTGMPEYNRPFFRRVEEMLRRQGYVVINPGCLPTDLPRDAYMPINLAMMDAADTCVLLEGWEESRGATLERSYAEFLGKGVYELVNNANKWFLIDHYSEYPIDDGWEETEE